MPSDTDRVVEEQVDLLLQHEDMALDVGLDRV
jgi:hypothetical protein